MNKAYLIAPAVLMIGFVAFERDAAAKRRERDAARSVAEAAQKLAKDQQLILLRQKTTEEARQRLEASAQKDREKAEQRERDYAAVLQKFDDETSAHAAAGRELAGETAEKQRELEALRARRHSAEQDSAEIAQRVRQSYTERRQAEDSLQQSTATLVARLNEALEPPAAPTAGPKG